jgi:malate dehydrogenase (oxaloacetate-decarboxylating)(NADP+)
MSADPTPATRPFTGTVLLHDAAVNRGTAFSAQARATLGLQGLLPPAVETLAQQVARVMDNVRRQATDLDRYVYLAAVRERNQTLYFRSVCEHLAETLPLIYTPTVGQACQEFSRRFQAPHGLYVTAQDRGRIRDILRHWPRPDVRVIVVTDGSRILGLGDLGLNGMGIPIGKLDLYVACGGVRPEACLPVMLDAGTDNAALRDDPFYLGLRQPRLQGEAYDTLLAEFVAAVQEVFPGALLQFEDFSNSNAFALLQRYRDRLRCFNDDIQGTGAMGLAGLYSALRLTGGRLGEQRLLFVGAGEAALGIAHMVTAAMQAEGLSEAQARRRCWLMDTQGLVVAGRPDLAGHKRAYAHAHAPLTGLQAAVAALRPSVLIGASGAPGLFSEPVLRELARLQTRPVVLALSNPTSRAECTAEQAYAWTDGQAIFASGSPFAPVTLAGRTQVPGQGNNAYIFPGLGLGVLASGATRVSDAMFFAAARALAAQVTDADLQCGRIYPGAERLRAVAAAVATAVAEVAFAEGLATAERPADPAAAIRGMMYDPDYPPLPGP